MARIAGVDIPREKRVIVSLTYIHGIGPTSAAKVIGAANVSADTRVRDLTEEEVNRLREVVATKATCFGCLGFEKSTTRTPSRSVDRSFW